MASGVATQPQVIDDLCVRMSNLEYMHGELVKKMEMVSDAENQQLQTRLSEMEKREGTLISYMSWMEDRLVALEKRLMGLPTGPQSNYLSFFYSLHQLVSKAEVLVKMPPRRNRPLTEAYEHEFEQRIMERMEERLGQFVDQLTDQKNNLMNNRRLHNRRREDEDEDSEENPFGDGSSSDEQSLMRPRRNQREDNRRWEYVTPNEPVDSLSMGDEHLNTIPATESDEFIKSSVENLIPNPSESEGENKCDVPAGFTTFSNVLFSADYDFDSGDDQSISDEDFPKKIYSNPLFDEEIIPIEIDQHTFNAESDLIGSMPNHDSSIIISSKIDSLFDEFAGELTLLKLFSPGIDETDCHPEQETRFAKRLLYDNSSPRQPKEIVSDNFNADIESFSPSPIPVEDSDSHMDEIDLPFNPDDPMPSGIEDDNYDSGRDIPILEELLDNYSLLLPASESYHFDIPSPYRPLAKPPDGNTGSLNIKMVGDISDPK
nr:reverse transcriptase domain-containing protein [Tanacetum cinerariifolium]